MLRSQEKNSTLTCVAGFLVLEKVTRYMSVQKLQYLYAGNSARMWRWTLVAVVDITANLSRNAKEC